MSKPKKETRPAPLKARPIAPDGGSYVLVDGKPVPEAEATHPALKQPAKED